MLDISGFALGQETMEETLAREGISGGIYAKYADQARKNIRFLRMIEIINDEEAQTMFNRVIAMVGRSVYDS